MEKRFLKKMIRTYRRAIHTENFPPEIESCYMQILNHLQAILRLMDNLPTTRMQDIDLKKSR